MRKRFLFLAVVIALVCQGSSVPAWSQGDLQPAAATPAGEAGEEDRTSIPDSRQPEGDPFGEEPRFPRWRFAGFGIRAMDLSGVGKKMGRITGGSDSALGLSLDYSEKYTRHLPLDASLTYAEFGDLLMSNLLAGVKYDLSESPRTAFTPWGGLYLSLNMLDDRSVIDQENDQEEDWDGFGIGAAAGVGFSLRLTADLILQASARVNRFGSVFILEDLKAGADRLTTFDLGLTLVLYENLQDASTHMEVWE